MRPAFKVAILYGFYLPPKPLITGFGGFLFWITYYSKVFYVTALNFFSNIP